MWIYFKSPYVVIMSYFLPCRNMTLIYDPYSILYIDISRHYVTL